MVTEKKKICITGAAGQTGRHILKALSPLAEQYHLCAAIHSAEQSNQENTVKSICPSACPCPLDADDIDACTEAFRGITDLFIVPSASEAKVRHAFNYIRAAKRANVPFVAVLSMTGCESRNYLWADQFWSIEEEVKRASLPAWCILRSSFYYQNLLLYADQYVEGYVPLPIGDKAKFAPVDVHDVGEAAAAILKDCKPHVGKTYTLTGPEAMTGPQITSVITEFVQKETQSSNKLEWRDISLNDAKRILLSAGVPAAEVQGFVEFYRAVKEAGAEFETTSEDFRKLVGRNPTGLRDWLTRIREHMLALISKKTGKSTQQQQQQFSQPTMASSQS